MKSKKAIRVLESIEYYLKTHTNESCEEEHTAIALAIKALEERPQGEWEEPFERSGKYYHKCTNCHISSEWILIDNFCPYCGAQMRGDTE